jgi:hypothetical protein
MFLVWKASSENVRKRAQREGRRRTQEYRNRRRGRLVEGLSLIISNGARGAMPQEPRCPRNYR